MSRQWWNTGVSQKFKPGFAVCEFLIDIPSMWLWPAYLSCCNVHLLRNWCIIKRKHTHHHSNCSELQIPVSQLGLTRDKQTWAKIINNTKFGWPFFAPHNGISVPFLVVPKKSSFRPRKKGQILHPILFVGFYPDNTGMVQALWKTAFPASFSIRFHAVLRSAS